MAQPSRPWIEILIRSLGNALIRPERLPTPIGSSTTGGFVVEKPPPPIEHTGFLPAGQGIAELRAVLGYKLVAPPVLRGRNDPNDRARCK